MAGEMFRPVIVLSEEFITALQLSRASDFYVAAPIGQEALLRFEAWASIDGRGLLVGWCDRGSPLVVLVDVLRWNLARRELGVIRVIDRRETAIWCSECGLTSHHPKDVEHRYCGMCHTFL